MDYKNKFFNIAKSNINYIEKYSILNKLLDNNLDFDINGNYEEYSHCWSLALILEEIYQYETYENEHIKLRYNMIEKLIMLGAFPDNNLNIGHKQLLFKNIVDYEKLKHGNCLLLINNIWKNNIFIKQYNKFYEIAYYKSEYKYTDFRDKYKLLNNILDENNNLNLNGPCGEYSNCWSIAVILEELYCQKYFKYMSQYDAEIHLQFRYNMIKKLILLGAIPDNLVNIGEYKHVFINLMDCDSNDCSFYDKYKNSYINFRNPKWNCKNLIK